MWAFFQQLDQVRQEQGRLLDALGWGPVRTPARVVLRRSGVVLKRYEAQAGESAPVLLLVPAPIKRAYLWDLDPKISIVRQALESGLHVYLLEWEWPARRAAALALADCADRLLLDCLAAIERDTGRRRVALGGHSLGGTLAAIFSTLHPERVRGLVLLGAPLHFGSPAGSFRRFAGVIAGLELVGEIPPVVPGSFLSLVTGALYPQSFGAERGFDLWVSLGEPSRLRTHLQVERWSLDELPLPRALFADVVGRLIRDDLFVRGELVVGGQLAAPERLSAPLLCVADARCEIVPPDAILPFVEAVGSKDTRLLWYEREIGVGLQHVGMLVGQNAHRRLWPAILTWVRDLAP